MLARYGRTQKERKKFKKVQYKQLYEKEEQEHKRYRKMGRNRYDLIFQKKRGRISDISLILLLCFFNFPNNVFQQSVGVENG